MAVLIDLAHARRARRLFNILVERHGITHFLLGGAEVRFRVDPKRLEEAVQLCAEWLHIRTARQPTQETLDWLRVDLRRALIQRVAECMVRAGY
jgi:hypothetical protein